MDNQNNPQNQRPNQVQNVYGVKPKASQFTESFIGIVIGSVTALAVVCVVLLTLPRLSWLGIFLPGLVGGLIASLVVEDKKKIIGLIIGVLSYLILIVVLLSPLYPEDCGGCSDSGEVFVAGLFFFLILGLFNIAAGKIGELVGSLLRRYFINK